MVDWSYAGWPATSGRANNIRYLEEDVLSITVVLREAGSP
jgi:hypothetical protein